MANKRPDGDGLVRKRSDGRWEGRIVVGHKSDGKPIYRSVFARTQKELMDKLHTQIEVHRDVELTEGYNLTLAQWLDKWLDEYKAYTIRESTLQGYKRLVKNYITPHLGDKKLGSITTADLQKLYNWLRKNGRINEHYEKGDALSDSMVRSIHMLLHQAMDAAVQQRLVVKNPTNGTVIPKNNYAPKQILTESQLTAFLEVAKQDPVWSDFFYTELTTGLRRGEICGLRWQDFDEKAGRLQIRRSVNTKNGGGVKVGETKTQTGNRSIQLPLRTSKGGGRRSAPN
jgi:integrase